jgi:hypothetical protein
MELTGAGTAPALPSPAGHVNGPRSEQPPQATVLPTGPAAVRTRLKWYTISTRVEGAARGVAKVIHPSREPQHKLDGHHAGTTFAC